MRVLLLICCMVVFCAGTPVLANSSTKNFAVSGTVKGSCVMPATVPLTFSTVVPTNGKLDPNLSNLRWTITGISCNAASSLSVSARALRLDLPHSSLASSQSQAINFTATAAGWTPSAASVTTGDSNPLGTTNYYSGTTMTQSAAKSGSINVTVSGFTVVGAKGNSSNSAKPIEGSYSATIVVVLSPSV